MAGHSPIRWSYNSGTDEGKRKLDEMKADLLRSDDLSQEFRVRSLCMNWYKEKDYLMQGMLFFVAEFGCAEAYSTLIILGWPDTTIIDEQTGLTPLHCTMLDKNLERGLKKAKERSHYEDGLTNISKFIPLDDKKRSLLHFAAWKSNEKAVEFFISKGMDVNGVDEEGKTPLHYAMMNAHESSTQLKVQLLLRKGANPNIKDNEGRLPFH